MVENTPKNKVLLVHCTANLYQELLNLAEVEFDVDATQSPAEALGAVTKHAYDLVIVGTKIYYQQEDMGYVLGDKLIDRMLKIREFEYARMGTQLYDIGNGYDGAFKHSLMLPLRALIAQIRTFFSSAYSGCILVVNQNNINFFGLEKRFTFIETNNLDEAKKLLQEVGCIDFVLIGDYLMDCGQIKSGDDIVDSLLSIKQFPYGRIISKKSETKAVNLICGIEISGNHKGVVTIDCNRTVSPEAQLAAYLNKT